MRNIYLELTDQFNAGRLRTIICSGQAVVLHRLAIMSKDGDWIIREDREALHHVLGVLSARASHYRFGAPLDERWMAGGWSAHFELQDSFRVRTDFFTRPPRIPAASLDRIWKQQEHRQPPFLDPPDLAEMKKTNREKDYIVIGELGRIMKDPADRFLYSRSPRDLIALARLHPELALAMALKRPALRDLDNGEDQLARALDEERRELIRRNENRLLIRMKASEEWRAAWSSLSRKIAELPLLEAHALVVQAAEGVLPFHVQETPNG